MLDSEVFCEGVEKGWKKGVEECSDRNGRQEDGGKGVVFSE